MRTSRSLRHEPVAAAAHREQVAGAIGVGLQLGAQLGHEVVDGADLALLEAPDLAHQLLAREDPAAVLAEEAQELELQVGQLYGAAGPGDGARVEIDGDV